LAPLTIKPEQVEEGLGILDEAFRACVEAD
jgi:4-aminobutyrate aminotransferase-like enzyme